MTIKMQGTYVIVRKKGAGNDNMPMKALTLREATDVAMRGCCDIMCWTSATWEAITSQTQDWDTLIRLCMFQQTRKRDVIIILYLTKE